jgi:hypothetical protein
VAPSPSSWPTSAPTRGKEGVRAALTFPPSPCRSSTGRGRGGEMSRAAAILRLRLSTMPRSYTRSPLSRSAGEGPGVRAALTFPPSPFRSSTGRGRGDEQSSSDPAPASHQITPLPQRGRGAGGEGSPHLPPNPLPLLHGERQGGRGGLVRKHGGPRTQWSNRHGTSLMQHPGF